MDGMTFGDLFGDSDSDEDEGPIPSSGIRDKPPAEPKPKPKPSKPSEGAKSELFDPFKFPTGTEFDLFAIRKLPKDLPTQQQREEDIARWNRKVQLHWERVRREQRDVAPAMTVVPDKNRGTTSQAH